MIVVMCFSRYLYLFNYPCLTLWYSVIVFVIVVLFVLCLYFLLFSSHQKSDCMCDAWVPFLKTRQACPAVVGLLLYIFLKLCSEVQLYLLLLRTWITKMYSIIFYLEVADSGFIQFTIFMLLFIKLSTLLYFIFLIRQLCLNKSL